MAAESHQAGYLPTLVDSSITYEDIATFPRPGCSAPDSIGFSPDDTVVIYLASSDGSLTRQLYAMDITSGSVQELCKPPSGTGEEATFSLEEKLRRERARQLHTGITSYALAEGDQGAGRILIPIANELYVQEGLGGTLQRLFDPAVLPAASPDAGADGAADAPILDARISGDGRLVGFVWRQEVYVVGTDCKSAPVQLTRGARGTELTNGLADYIAQEEMSRYEGYWISPDSSMIAFEQVDESMVPKYRIMHQGSDKVGEGQQEDHHYPFAGCGNPMVKLGVVSTEGGEVRWLDLEASFGPDLYLPRVKWLPDNTLIVQVQNRAQTVVEVIRIWPQTNERKVLLSEQNDAWVNLHKMFTPLKNTQRFIWASERSGFQHLYLYDYNGKVERQLTDGEWMVEEVKGVDEQTGLVFFMGSKSGWLERHLYSVPLEGGAVVQITKEAGMHNVILDHRHQLFVDQFSSASLPFRVNVCDVKDGSVVRPLHANNDARLPRLNLSPPQFATFPSLDGRVTLQAAVLRPDPAKFGPGPYPTIVPVYGGPHVQTVSNSWTLTADLRSQFLCTQGYLVLKIDNRGSSRRGLFFESEVKWDMGNLEVQDQKAGVEWAVAQGLTDPKRVGIYGWSYGGYMAAMALARAPDVFQVGVAGAPVTSWDGYDTHYTERYMGTPQGNPDGYSRSAVMTHVDNIQGSLLLVGPRIHGAAHPLLHPALARQHGPEAV
ncbi:dipeptidyl peptidase IV N-terminal region-domain-containing protein, partial [Baffinella frigidus]